MPQRGYPQFGRSDNSQLEFLHFFNVSMGCPAPEKLRNVMRVNLLSQIKSSKIGQKLLIVRKLSPWKRDCEKHFLTDLMSWPERAGHAISKNTKFVEIGQKKVSKGPKSVYHRLSIQTLLKNHTRFHFHKTLVMCWKIGKFLKLENFWMGIILALIKKWENELVFQ